MKIAIILGTRPEIIKLSPIIRECQNQNLNYFILHTGQHYSYEMDRIFFEELELPLPEYNLNVGSGSHAEETGKMLVGIEEMLLKEKPDIVVVEGDTNSVLAGALAAVKLGIKVGHVEAGLRSYDRTMPEEINRVLTDHMSDLLFAPTPNAMDILLGEGIEESKIYVTGNTIVDAVYQNRELADKKSDALDKLNLKAGEYFLATLHRQENVDNAARFASILQGLKKLLERYGISVVYPVHPRSRKKLDEFKLNTDKLNVIDPVDFLDFLHLELIISRIEFGNDFTLLYLITDLDSKLLYSPTNLEAKLGFYACLCGTRKSSDHTPFFDRYLLKSDWPDNLLGFC